METALWSDMFRLGLPVAEKILRPTFVYAFLVIGLRMAGKRELAQLNPFDLVVLLTLSNTVQNAIIGEDTSLTGGVIGATTLLLLNYIVVRFVYRHAALARLIEGRPTVLIDNGHVLTEQLRKEVLTMSELDAAAHRQGFDTLEEVERAILEPGGTIVFGARQPSPEVMRHQEVLTRMDALSRDVQRMNDALSRRGTT